MALFKSKSQRVLKKARDMAESDMVDQAAVLMEEEIETLLEEKDTARQIIPFLMDVGHPDLAARLSERIVKAHSDLRAGVVKMLEDKLGQFSRSTELLRVLWRYRLRSKDYSGMLDLLSTVDRLTESRFTDSVESAYNALSRFSGDEIKNTEPYLAVAVVLHRKGRPSEAVDVLVEAAKRSSFPDESFARLSGWIANRTGGSDMAVNLGRVRILVALSDNEQAIAELGTLIQADTETIEKAIALAEQSLIPADTSGRASVALARLMAAAGRVNDACAVLEGLLEKEVEGGALEQAAAGIVMASPGSARANLLQARIRMARNEISQGIESLTRAFECEDLDGAPVAEVCRSVIERGMDREGRVARRLGEFLVEKGSVEDSVQIVLCLLEQDQEWVFTQIQKLLQREKTNASVLTLLAVHKLLAGRDGEAGATLQHLSSRKDLKSRSDIAAVLGRLSHLMDRYPRLRRFRASTTGSIGDSRQSSEDWFALLLQGERVPEKGLLEIADSGLSGDKARAVLDSKFKPDCPAGHLVMAAAAVSLEDPATASPAMAEAVKDGALAERVAGLVANIRLSMLQKTSTETFLPALNEAGKGDVVAKVLPLLADPDKREDWMDSLAARVDTGDPQETALFRLDYFIEAGCLGTGAVSVESLELPPGPVADLALGCRAAAAGDRRKAVELLSSASEGASTAHLARAVLESMAGEEKSGLTVMALARSLVNTGDLAKAASVLEGSIDAPEVRSFLEENCPRHVEGWELWKLLALARLGAGDGPGFVLAANTVLEKSSSPARELAGAALDHGLKKSDPDTLLFAVTTADRHSTDLDTTGAACALLRIDPTLSPRLSSLEKIGPPVRALLGIITGDTELFLTDGAPTDLYPPPESVERCIEQWASQEMWQALHRLMQTCDASGLGAAAHRIRTCLAGKGFPEVEGMLLEDAIADPGNRLDFWKHVESEDLLIRGLSELLPGGASMDPDEAMAAGRALAGSSVKGETLMAFANRLAGQFGNSLSDTVALLLDRALGTTPADATPELIRLLAAAGKVRDAYLKARGDDGMLAALREALDGDRPGEASPEESLWARGSREAACAGWLAKYRETGDIRWLTRLQWAFSQMGLPVEGAALERFIQERHPGREPVAGRSGRAWVLSDLDIGKRRMGRGMTNGG